MITNWEQIEKRAKESEMALAYMRDHPLTHEQATKQVQQLKDKNTDMTEEEIIKDLMEFIPKDDLTEEEFDEAKRVWETSRLSFDVVKYIRSVHPEEGSKWAKGYFDLYIDDRHYDKV